MSNANRGTAAIFLAKLFFLFSGYALYAALGRILTVEEFGLYGVIFGVVSLVNMVVVNGTLQTVSHFVAAAPDGSGALIRFKGLRYQAYFAIALSLLAFPAAPFASHLLNDSNLTPHLRYAVLISGVYALYAVNVGFLNGSRRFVRQASLDVGFAVMKVSFIVLAAFLGFGLQGIIGGFIVAAVLILLLSIPMCRIDFVAQQN